MGVEFVRGLQGDDPRYLKVVATAKHFAVHSGPGAGPPQLRRAAQRARPVRDLPARVPGPGPGRRSVASVMGAYNRVNGESASASQRLLLRHPAPGLGLRRLRGLRLRRHRRHLQAPQDRGHAGGGGRARRAPRAATWSAGRRTSRSRGALAQGLITEADLDVALRRLMVARLRSACSTRPSACRYAQIPYTREPVGGARPAGPAHGAGIDRPAQERRPAAALARDLKTIAVGRARTPTR